MITIRRARFEDAAGIAKVHVDGWRTTYAGIVPDDYLANLSYQQRTTRWEENLRNAGNRFIIYVAENEQQEIVGFVGLRAEPPLAPFL